MNYFLLHSNPRYINAPEILNWAKHIDPRDIRSGRTYKFPARQILAVRPSQHTVFIDVISSPFLLFSKQCMDVVKYYEPQTISRQVILLDMKYPKRKTYYLPFLKQIKCLAEGSHFNLDKSILLKGVVNLDHIGDAALFQLADLNNTYTVIRLDMLESMLKRGARGIGITPIDVIKGDD